MKKISAYECRYKEQFDASGAFGSGTLLTARQKLARLIDSNWFHSHHWPQDHNTFLDKAQDDLNTELAYARDRLAGLEQAQNIISAIDRDSDPEAENEAP